MHASETQRHEGSTLRRTVPLAIALAALAGCGGSGSGEPADAGDADGALDADAGDGAAAPEGWPDWSTSLRVRDGTTAEGDLADGRTWPMGWATDQDVGCWFQASEAERYTGRQVLHHFDEALATGQSFRVEAAPADGVDVDVYAYGLPADTVRIPPDIQAVRSCPTSTDGGPGEPESVVLSNPGDPTVWAVVVASPEGASEGAFSLTLEEL